MVNKTRGRVALGGRTYAIDEVEYWQQLVRHVGRYLKMKLDFFRVLQELDEDAYLLVVTSASRVVDDLELIIEIRSQEDESVQRWKLTCLGVREHAITFGFCDNGPQLSREHVLLWAHQKPVVSLYFHGTASNVPAIVGALYSKHFEMMGNWAPFARWLNAQANLPSLIEGCYGLLAEGPEPLILGYNHVMKEAGFNTSLLSRPPKHWNRGRWVDAAGPLVVLTCGNTYAVAAEITSARLLSETA